MPFHTSSTKWEERDARHTQLALFWRGKKERSHFINVKKVKPGCLYCLLLFTGTYIGAGLFSRLPTDADSREHHSWEQHYDRGDDPPTVESRVPYVPEDPSPCWWTGRVLCCSSLFFACTEVEGSIKEPLFQDWPGTWFDSEQIVWWHNTFWGMRLTSNFKNWKKGPVELWSQQGNTINMPDGIAVIQTKWCPKVPNSRNKLPPRPHLKHWPIHTLQ